jgi:hypothetical protein
MKALVYQLNKIKNQDKGCKLCWVRAIFIP